MIDFNADLDVFLSSDEFAVKAMVDGRVFPVIFDREHQQTEQDDVVMVNREPVLKAKSADFESVARGALVSISSTVFRVRHIEHDGTGMCEVYLKEGSV